MNFFQPSQYILNDPNERFLVFLKITYIVTIIFLVWTFVLGPFLFLLASISDILSTLFVLWIFTPSLTPILAVIVTPMILISLVLSAMRGIKMSKIKIFILILGFVIGLFLVFFRLVGSTM